MKKVIKWVIGLFSLAIFISLSFGSVSAATTYSDYTRASLLYKDWRDYNWQYHTPYLRYFDYYRYRYAYSPTLTSYYGGDYSLGYIQYRYPYLYNMQMPLKYGYGHIPFVLGPYGPYPLWVSSKETISYYYPRY